MREPRQKHFDDVGYRLTNVVQSSEKKLSAELGLEIHDGGWVKVNTSILALYSGVSKYNGAYQGAAGVCIMLFHGIMYTKWSYEVKGKPNEDKRIYNDKPLDERDILRAVYPSKYDIGGFDINNDVSNMRKRLWKLHELNIFYRFTYGSTNIFFMERLFWSWKCYNQLGVVVPRRIQSMVDLKFDVVHRVVEIEKLKRRHVDPDKVEKAYMSFLMEMIDKAAPAVASKLPRWSEGVDILMYLPDLEDALGKIDEMEGMEYDEHCLARLPPSIQDKIERIPMKNGDNNSIDMSKELSPTKKGAVNVNRKLSKKKPRKKPASIIDTSSELMVDIGNFGDDLPALEPFKNSDEFYRFYKGTIKMHIRASESSVYPQFASYDSERGIVDEIFDLLKEHDKEDQSFLSEWILNYCRKFLVGKKSEDVGNTSLRKFKNTFAEFDSSYHIPQ